MVTYGIVRGELVRVRAVAEAALWEEVKRCKVSVGRPTSNWRREYTAVHIREAGPREERLPAREGHDRTSGAREESRGA